MHPVCVSSRDAILCGVCSRGFPSVLCIPVMLSCVGCVPVDSRDVPVSYVYSRDAILCGVCSREFPSVLCIPVMLSCVVCVPVDSRDVRVLTW
jgi:uncharacterized protein YbaR (Trm112 family)